MASMFAKIFGQIFDSSIAEDYKIRHMFMDLLVMADSDGVVDKTPEAISRIANVPIGHVKSALAVLSAPDDKSRTPDDDGRRIVLIDEHRDWGWRIVNFQKYREIRDEEARRIANRSYKRDERARKRQHVSAPCPDSQQCQPRSAHTEAEADTEKEKTKTWAVSDLEHATQFLFLELHLSGMHNRVKCQEAVKAYAHAKKCSETDAAKGLLDSWKRYEVIPGKYKTGKVGFLEKGVWDSEDSWTTKNSELSMGGW